MGHKGAIEGLLAGDVGGWYFGPDRSRTKAAVQEALETFSGEQLAALLAGELRVQVTAPPCSTRFHVASVQVVFPGAAEGYRAEVRLEVIYLAAELESLPIEELRKSVFQAFVVAVERLAGHSDLQSLQAAGMIAGPSERPN